MAPEMVEVVQAALAAHQRLTLALYPDYYCCTCGERSIEQPSAHQARAVLAALTEAGKVQFGVRWHVGGCSGINRCTSKRHAERQAAKLIESGHEATVVSRLALPWTKAVE